MANTARAIDVHLNGEKRYGGSDPSVCKVDAFTAIGDPINLALTPAGPAWFGNLVCPGTRVSHLQFEEAMKIARRIVLFALTLSLLAAARSLRRRLEAECGAIKVPEGCAGLFLRNHPD